MSSGENDDLLLARSLDIEGRIDFINQDSWFDLPFASALIDRLKMLIRHPSKVRPRCMLITGASGMGKTALIERFTDLYPPQHNAKTGVTTIPVSRLEMPSPAHQSTLLEEFLSALNVPRPALPFRLLQSFVAKQYLNLGVKMVLVDEAQRVRLVGLPVAHHCCEQLKWLSNVIRRPVVALGTVEAVPYFEQDVQLRSRFAQVEIPRWTLNETFMQLVKTQLLQLPLRDEWDPEILKRNGLQLILQRSDGLTAGVINIIKDAAIDVLLDGRERLMMADIEAIR